MATDAMAEGRIVETRIPARLDRLPWSHWHWMVLVGLRTVWILRGHDRRDDLLAADRGRLRAGAERQPDRLREPRKAIKVREQERVGFITIAKTVFGAYPRRTIVGLSLFIGQAFLHNAVFFTYALVLGTFYDVKPASVGWYIIPFALGNFLGPLVLGRLFDSVGRKPMIAGTYIVSGLLLIVTAFLFRAGTWTAETQTAAWSVIFFFASAGASAAYLTVSEIFPMETRALAIAFFYAVGTAAGGITGPLLFGRWSSPRRPARCSGATCSARC
jgi:predicted MFS family arabinose efflux permease